MKSDMEHSLDERQSLEIIRAMIDNAKSNLKDQGFYFLLWGWLVLAGSLGHFVLMTVFKVPFASFIWFVLLAIGAVGTIVKAVRENKASRVRTHIDTLTTFLWLGIGSCMFILVGISLGGSMNFQVTYPLFIMFFGLGTFITGGVVRFYPLIIGGIAAWLVAIVTFFVSFEYQLLLMALGITVSYLVPGYMLNRRE